MEKKAANRYGGSAIATDNSRGGKGGALTLSDQEGRESFPLTAAEVDSVATLVASAGFASAMADDQSCSYGLHEQVDVVVRWDGAEEQSNQGTSCMYDSLAENPHVYNRLKWLLFELQEKYLECPPPASATDMSYRRNLCTGCFALEQPCTGN